MIARLCLLPIAVACSACFQMTTVVKVSGDGSGTIDHTMVVAKQALAQLRSFGALGGGRGGQIDLTSEDQARAMADTLGPGVAYVSSESIDTPLGVGRHTTYAFTDVSRIRISEKPDTGGLGIKTQALDSAAGEITCSLTHEENGNATLHINLPELNLGGTPLGDASAGGPSLAQQLAMVRALLAGAHVAIGVEPAGAIVKTNSPFVDGGRVTLLDVELDKLLGNEAVLLKLQAAKTTDDVKAALKDVPGVKAVLEREVTIEFTPAK
jgi:hypothetical protein